ncbi:MAG TPA: RsmD family RNA methyltransferase, partial [Thermoanaerobaculia bacterium]
AISRGAKEAIAVDIARANVAAIEKHAGALNANVIAIAGDVRVALKRIGDKTVDVLYADPPYAYDQYDELLTALDTVQFAQQAIIAVEHRRNTEPFGEKPHRLQFVRRAEYGEVWISFFDAATP